MKLSMANRISSMCINDLPSDDASLADTLEVHTCYTDCVYLYQSNDPGCDSLADAWLNHLYQGG